jgi:predicted O-methyltransferase YrrM
MFNDVIREIERGYAQHRFGGYTMLEHMPNGGSITPLEARIIHSICAAQSPQIALEIGCFFGYSTMFLAEAMKNHGQPGAILHSVDINDTFLEIAATNVKKARLDSVVQFYNVEKDEIPEVTYDLVFVDGDHTTPGVLADWEFIAGNTRIGGLVIFHDAKNVDVARALATIGTDVVLPTELGIALRWVKDEDLDRYGNI